MRLWATLWAAFISASEITAADLARGLKMLPFCALPHRVGAIRWEWGRSAPKQAAGV